jgi:hypothetical protein
MTDLCGSLPEAGRVVVAEHVQQVQHCSLLMCLLHIKQVTIFHILISVVYLAVLWIHDILVWIRIRIRL